MPALRHLFNRSRFGAFLWRFAPFWMVWLLILVFSPTREYARLIFRGSEVVRNIASFGDLFWFFGGYQDSFDPDELAKKAPHDPNLAWWKFSREQPNSSYSGTSSWPSDANFSREWALSNRFPNELWLHALPLRRALNSPTQVIYNPFRHGPSLQPLPGLKKTQKLRELARSGAQKEPQNAFWPLAGALVHLGTTERGAILPMIERAALCDYYSDKSLEAARRLMRVQSRFRNLSFEERGSLLSRDGGNYYGYAFYGQGAALDVLASVVLREAKSALARGDKKRAMQLAGTLLHLSRMLMEGDNSTMVAQSGMRWQNWVRALALAPKAQKGNALRAIPNAATWRKFVRQNGAPELADRSMRLQTRAARLQKWLKSSSSQPISEWPLRFLQLTDGAEPQTGLQNSTGAFARSVVARWMGMVLVAALLYLLAFWVFANLFLARGVGAHSNRRDRVLPAVLLGILSTILGIGLFFGIILFFNPGRGMRVPGREELFISLALFSFFWLPFGLGLWCALGTMRRNRKMWFLTPRLDLELQLSRFNARLQRDFLPFGVACALFTFLFGWALWIYGTYQSWGRVNLLDLLPPDRNGKVGDIISLEIYASEPWVAIYGVFICIVFFAAWFFKWRYFSPPELKILAHSGLRWWKESLGATICLASLLFGVVAFASVPSRFQAARQIEELAKHGELHFAPGGAFLEGKNPQKQNVVEGARL